MRHSLFRILNPTAALFNRLVLLRLFFILLATLVGISRQPELAHWLALACTWPRPWHYHFIVKPNAPALMTSLLIDISALGFLLYLNDGVLSGWVSLLFFPALVGALALPSLWAWIVTGSSLLVYSSLMLVYLETLGANEHAMHHGHMDMSDHLLGMLVTFFVSVILLTFFITQQAKGLRLQQQQLNLLQDRRWREQQILSMATLSANTTHKFATPLASALLLLEELQEESQSLAEQDRQALQQVQTQLARCQSAMQELVEQARSVDPDTKEMKLVDTWLNELVDNWWSSHNEVKVSLHLDPALQQQTLETTANLNFAITNLLDNAAKACREVPSPQITIRASEQNGQLSLTVDDNGEGLTEDLLQHLGNGFLQSDSGLGIGVSLAQAAIDQIGGVITMQNQQVGVRTQVQIPFKYQALNQ